MKRLKVACEILVASNITGWLLKASENHGWQQEVPLIGKGFVQPRCGLELSPSSLDEMHS